MGSRRQACVTVCALGASTNMLLLPRFGCSAAHTAAAVAVAAATAAAAVSPSRHTAAPQLKRSHVITTNLLRLPQRLLGLLQPLERVGVAANVAEASEVAHVR